jgi:hypothetical protein
VGLAQLVVISAPFVVDLLCYVMCRPYGAWDFHASMVPPLPRWATLFRPWRDWREIGAQVKLNKEFTKRGGSGSAPARRKYTHTRVKEGFGGQIGVRLNCFDYLPIVNVWKK